MMMDQLRQVLRGVPIGAISGPTADAVLSALTVIWDEIDGSDFGAMGSHKVARAESLKWDPPVLSFLIERHGGTVMGSKRAEIHQWSVDVERGSADVASVGHRQLQPNSPRWGKAEAAEAAKRAVEAILEGRDEPYLRWTKAGRVQVLGSQVVPDGPKQTVEGRKHRFRLAFAEQADDLKAAGWVSDGRYWGRET